MTRRELLLFSSVSSVFAQALPLPEPQNSSPSPQSVNGSVTSPDLFFVRDHFGEPQLSLTAWRLKIQGHVTRSLELSFADLIESPAKQIEAVLECAGNPAGGGAAGNALWEGVPLAHFLEQAGTAPNTVAALFEGADAGRLMEDSPHLPYCRLVPIEKCLRPESLLAFKLNGRFLPRKNGFPARVLFPGWYGMDSVKWLQRIVLLGSSDLAPNFQASGMNKIYNRLERNGAGELKATPLTEIQVRSIIAWPPDQSRLPARRHLVRGFAWTGGARMIQGIGFSADGGRTWLPAKIGAQPQPFTWVQWSFLWSAEPGEHVLMSRAIDDAGHQQPLSRDPARRDLYELNFCTPIRCSVR